MSPNKINVLPEEVINKIAAGEVIERPASIVKELLENSLDAGATEIALEINNGGKKLISVVDNGSGIPAAEVELAFQRHATSKLKSFEDLNCLNTLGFRGEALPSIASISKVTMVTGTVADMSAVKIQISAGKVQSRQEEGARPGTAIKVENIFFNTPARLKFLKSDNTEYTHILNTVMEQAIAHFKVGFTLKNDGKETLRAPAAATLAERLYDLFGKEIQQNLLPLSLEQKFLSISGFVSTPALARPNRHQQYFYVNARSVKHRLLNHAVSAGYGTLLPNGKYPQVFIFFNLNPELVDVNVHPTKREVRFSNEGAIHELLVTAIKNALANKLNIPKIEDKESRQVPLNENSLGALLKNYDSRAVQTETLFAIKDEAPAAYASRGSRPVNTLILGEVSVLGQADNAYIVAASPSGLFIIDQHAASERVMYEKFQEEFSRNAILSQKLLIPITLELDPAAKQVLLAHNQLLEKLGWEVEEFGQNTVLIRALPAVLEKTGDRQFILDIVKELTSAQEIMDLPTTSDIKDTGLDNILKLSACHAAVRVGDQLDIEAMRQLVNSLTSARTPYTCPHGRPTIIQLTRTELNKRFGRT